MKGSIGAVKILLSVAVVGSALALGSLHTIVLCVFALVSMAAMVMAWSLPDTPTFPRRAANIFVYVGLALIAWTFLQSVPIPRWFLALFSPHAADVWARSLSPFRESGPFFASISLDPIATRVEVLRGLTYISTYLAALVVARRNDGTEFLERLVVASVVTVAALTFLHSILELDQVFGIYQPEVVRPGHRISPLLNFNHLGAYINIGLCLALGDTLSSRPTLPRYAAYSLVALLGASEVFAASRGGVGCTFLAIMVTTAMWIARQKKADRHMRPILLGLAFFITAGGLTVAFADATVWSDLFSLDFAKVDVIRESFKLVQKSPLCGIGRGAFQSTFPEVKTGTEYLTYTHPENIVAQWTVEWGLPAAIGAFIAFGFAMRPSTALTRAISPIGAWTAILIWATQNMVDFSSEVPGVMIAVSVCAAVVSGGIGRPGQQTPLWVVHAPKMVKGIAGATVVFVVLALIGRPHELHIEEIELRAHTINPTYPQAALRSELRSAMLRHPAAPYFPFLGALRAGMMRDDPVLPWAARALERSPVYGRVHLLLARWLAPMSPSQARLEYRIAGEQDENQLTAVINEGPRLVSNFDDALELAPNGKHGALVLEAISKALGQRAPATQLEIDEKLLELSPDAQAPNARKAARILHDILENEPWCTDSARNACIDAGETVSKHLIETSASLCDGYWYLSSFRAARGDLDAAIRDLEQAVSKVEDRAICLQRLAQLLMTSNSKSKIDSAVDRITRLGCSTEEECVANITMASAIERQRGNLRHALALLRRACERSGDRKDLLIESAALASSLSLHAEAYDAYRRLVRVEPDEPKWKAAMAAEQEAVDKARFSPPPASSAP